MATDFQYANFPISPDGSMGFKNYGVTAIAEGVLVMADTSNPPTGSSSILGGIVATTGDTVLPLGITMETIPAGGTGRVRLCSTAAQYCANDSGVTYGDALMPGTTAGRVMTRTTGKPFVGQALNSAAAGDPVLVLLGGPCLTS